jgi:hypothetical protein
MWTAEEIEQLRSLLMEECDPIGVHHFADDDENRESYWDEYDSYIPAILSDLDSGGSPHVAAAFSPPPSCSARPPT